MSETEEVLAVFEEMRDHICEVGGHGWGIMSGVAARLRASEARAADLRKDLQAAQTEKAGLEASRIRWKAEAEAAKAEAERWKAAAMGKITPEWRAIHEAGAKPIEG